MNLVKRKKTELSTNILRTLSQAIASELRCSKIFPVQVKHRYGEQQLQLITLNAASTLSSS